MKNIKNGKVFKKDEKVQWKCRNCGHIHTGESAQQLYPACAHPQNYFEMNCDNY